jgi:hypothetical protein
MLGQSLRPGPHLVIQFSHRTWGKSKVRLCFGGGILACGESGILEIKRLPSLDGREPGAVDHHIAGGGGKVVFVLLRAGHPKAAVKNVIPIQVPAS